ncbi:hypothetical protein HDV01_001245 [Terramyces sp. JEL0728]|nr:hypothetical protein HDV01_001245 [Terramyces sp. JEL0728]
MSTPELNQPEKLRPWSGSIVCPKKEKVSSIHRRYEESFALPVINIFQETGSSFDNESDCNSITDKRGKLANSQDFRNGIATPVSPKPNYVEKIIQIQEMQKPMHIKRDFPKVRPKTPQRCFVEHTRLKRPNTAVSFRDNTPVDINDTKTSKNRPATAKSLISDVNWDYLTRSQSAATYSKPISRPNTAKWYNPLEPESKTRKINKLIRRQHQIEMARPSTGRPSTGKTLYGAFSEKMIPQSNSPWPGIQDISGTAPSPSTLCTPGTANNSIADGSTPELSIPIDNAASIIVMNGEIAHTSASYNNFMQKVQHFPKDLLDYYMCHLEQYLRMTRYIIPRLETLLQEFPSITTWVFKMNETTDKFGLAEFTRTKEKSLVQDLLRNLKCITSHNWGNPAAYFHLFVRHGGVIEAKVPADYKKVQHPYFYYQILPDYTMACLGSCNMLPYREYEFCGMFTPCNVANKHELREKASRIAKNFENQKYMGFLAIEFIQWFDDQKHTTWVKSIKPYYTAELGQLQYTRLVSKCTAFRDESFIHVPSPDEEPEFKHLKKLKHFEMVSRLAQIFDRVGIYLWGLHNDMIAGLSNKSFECLCVENNIIMDLNYCGTHLPDLGQDDLTKTFNMLVIDQSLEQVVERLFKNFILLCRTLHHETTHNFLELCQIIYDSVVDKLPQYEKCPLPYELNELELFVYEKVHAWGLFNDTKEGTEKLQAVQMLSTAAIQLLNLDIPSSELKLDPFYGRISIVKPQVSKTKIQPGTTSVEEYLKIMSNLADLGIESDAKTNRRASILRERKRSTYRKPKQVSTVPE